MFAIVLTCCLAGTTFFSFLGLFLDLCFVGAMIAIAVLTRHGASSCSGNVNTPLGSGPSNSNAAGYGANGFGFGSNENATYAPNLGLACRLNTAAFAVSLVGALFFLITALMQILLNRHHKKEKRYGPSPSNDYTSGYGKRKFWQRKPKDATEKDAEFDAAGAGVGAGVGSGLASPHPDLRPSHDTAYTGSTVAAPNATTAPHVKEAETDFPEHAPHVGWSPHNANGGRNPAPSGYYTSPQTSVNPFVYDNTVPAIGTARNF